MAPYRIAVQRGASMSNSREIRIISPVDGRTYASESYASPSDIQAAVERATRSFNAWRKSPISERSALVNALAEALKQRKEELAEAVAWQIGRPIALADETPRFAIVTEKHVEATKVLHQEAYNADPGIERFVRREAQGLHLSIAPWNYPVGLLPWLVVAPILGGNVVILKHSDQTAVINRIVQEAYNSIRGPAGVLQTLNMTHKDTGTMIRSGKARGMNFIGSVRGGLEVHRMAAGTLTHVHLELGGKDPAYVRADAELATAIPDIADGTFSNSGQSCCSVERIYVHQSVHDEFVERFIAETETWTLGNPITDNPELGPVAKKGAADYIRSQTAKAVSHGATAFAPKQATVFAKRDTCYVAPMVLTGVNAAMSIMQEELFGPVACIQKVRNDEEAVALMNDSKYGLTASIWTRDTVSGVKLGDELETGTVFVNRCDHADLYLPWGGQKMSGMGRGNGREGLLRVTDTKSFHVKAGE
jgi:acyl-CoA reductase-like NAD-dependent aldehyde dehydrogenase